jgi:hypothetical protein
MPPAGTHAGRKTGPACPFLLGPFLLQEVQIFLFFSGLLQSEKQDQLLKQKNDCRVSSAVA